MLRVWTSGSEGGGLYQCTRATGTKYHELVAQTTDIAGVPEEGLGEGWGV